MKCSRADGTWRATWYSGAAYGTALAIRLLRETGAGGTSIVRARSFLAGSQHEDGSWGNDDASQALQTALSMAALAEAGSQSGRTALLRGAAALTARQLSDGSWDASPWIQMEIGRATGKIMHVATYRSVTLTTAFCLRALLEATFAIEPRSRDEERETR